MQAPSKLATLAILSVSAISHAGDATWVTCKGVATIGDKAPRSRMLVAASLVEHRADDGASRDLEVTLIKGANVALGTIRGDQSGPLEVHSVAGKHPALFTGKAGLSGDMKTFTLTGKLDTTFGSDPKAKPERVEAKLSCETLDDLAIRH
jgi:hypothetical protein